MGVPLCLRSIQFPTNLIRIPSLANGSAYAYKYAVAKRGLPGRKRSSQGRSLTPASHRFPTLRAFRLRPHANKTSGFVKIRVKN